MHTSRNEEGVMGDELECAWKETTLAYFKAWSRDSRVWSNKTDENLRVG